MNWMIFGLSLFLAVHVIALVSPWKIGLQRKLGYRPYLSLFAFLSGTGVIMAVGALLNSSREVLWNPPLWGQPVAFIVMPLGLFLVASAYVHGVVRRTVIHPMLIGTLLISGAHMIASGDRGTTFFFGTFGGYAFLSLLVAQWKRDSGHVSFTKIILAESFSVAMAGLGMVVLVKAHVFQARAPL
jgi:uncharacterized membrane protein